MRWLNLTAVAAVSYAAGSGALRAAVGLAAVWGAVWVGAISVRLSEPRRTPRRREPEPAMLRPFDWGRYPE